MWVIRSVIKKFIMKILISGSYYNIKKFYNNTTWNDLYMCSFINKFTIKGNCFNKVELIDSFSDKLNFKSTYNIENKYFNKFTICDYSTQQMPNIATVLHQKIPENGEYTICAYSDVHGNVYVGGEMKFSMQPNTVYFKKYYINKGSDVKITLSNKNSALKFKIDMLSDNYYTNTYEMMLSMDRKGDIVIPVKSKKMIVRCLSTNPSMSYIWDSDCSLVFGGRRYSNIDLTPLMPELRWNMTSEQDLFSVYFESNSVSELKYNIGKVSNNGKFKLIIYYMDESKLTYDFSNEYGFLAFEK